MNESIRKPVVIVGGGIAGLEVAKVLSDNGLATLIVERHERLGGHVREWACMATDRCLRCYCCSVQDLIEEIESSSLVTVLSGWQMSSRHQSARVGLTSLVTGEEKVADCEALVLATGFEPYDPRGKPLLGYGSMAGVLTLKDLDSLVRSDGIERLADGSQGPLNLAFFQCVGSRDKSIDANYCSQYCCKAALRMGLKLRAEQPDWGITIFYIDLQLAGKFAGSLLLEAERSNIRLAQGVPGEILAGPEGTLEVVCQRNGSNVRERFHRIILSIGQRPPDSAERIGAITGLPLDEFGFLAASSPASPSCSPIPGLYLAGACTGPKDIEQTLAHADLTAAEIIADLSRG